MCAWIWGQLLEYGPPTSGYIPKEEWVSLYQKLPTPSNSSSRDRESWTPPPSMQDFLAGLIMCKSCTATDAVNLWIQYSGNVLKVTFHNNTLCPLALTVFLPSLHWCSQSFGRGNINPEQSSWPRVYLAIVVLMNIHVKLLCKYLCLYQYTDCSQLGSEKVFESSNQCRDLYVGPCAKNKRL